MIANWREDWLARMTKPGVSAEDVFVELSKIVGNLGFEFCSFGVRVPSFNRVQQSSPKKFGLAELTNSRRQAQPQGAPKEAWSTTYPAAWQRRYLGSNYMAIDPVIAGAMRGTLPVVWSSEQSDTAPREARLDEFWEEARAHQIRHGWTFSVRGVAGQIGLLSLSRSVGVLSSRELADAEPKMMWLTQTANSVVSSLVSVQSRRLVYQPLSEREHEVLCWTACGKTSAEIGLILGIAKRTVDFHINAAVIKLRSVNRTQAVAKAVLLGILH